MNVPVLVRETPPLEPFIAGRAGQRDRRCTGGNADRGAVLGSGRAASAGRARAEILLDKLSYRQRSRCSRCVFSDVENGRREMPPNWRRAVELAKDVPGRTKTDRRSGGRNARAIKWPRPGVVRVVEVRLRQPGERGRRRHRRHGDKHRYRTRPIPVAAECSRQVPASSRLHGRRNGHRRQRSDARGRGRGGRTARAAPEPCRGARNKRSRDSSGR